MKILVLVTLAVAVAADVSSLNLHYGLPGSSYDVPQNSVTGSARFFEVSPTSPSPILHVPIHEAQDFNAQITNVGISGYSTPSSLLDYSFTTPAPSLASQQSFISTTPAPNVDISSFSTPASIIDAGFSQTTAAPSLSLNSGFQSYQFPSRYNFGLNTFSTAAPIINFGSGQLTSIDSSLFNRDAVINSAHVTTSGGSIDDAFGISTPASISAEIYQDEPPAPQVNRHLYFFAAPEEPEPIRPRIKIASQPQKNVRLIFVKAPSPPAIAPVQITAPQQNEEKTVVYVLVKKPEDTQDIRVEQAPSPVPPKPEVYFIKYKNQQEAEEAVKNIQAGNPHPQFSASDVNGGNGFVANLNRQYTKPEPIVKYVRPAGQVQEQSFGFTTAAPSVNLGFQQSSFNSYPVFNSRIAYTTPSTIQYSTQSPIQYSTPSPIQFSTSAPFQYNSGLSYTTAAPSVNFDSGFNGLNLASSQIVDNADVNQNVIESSTVAPQKIEVDTKINAGSFVASTAAPQTENVVLDNFASGNSFSPNVAERRFGVYETSSPAPFRVYGSPNYKK